MDLGTLLGIVLASAAILIGHAMEGGSILQILQPTAAMIVFGGTLGATMISFPMSVFKQAVADLLHIFKEDEIHPNEVIDQVSGSPTRHAEKESFPWKRKRAR